MSGAREWNAVIRLAVCRYRDVDPQMALAMFLSDRRTAGLGALDIARHRLVPRPVFNVKCEVNLGRDIEWQCGLNQPARQEWPRRLARDMQADGDLASIRIITHPPRHVELRLRIPARDLRTQVDRDIVARKLRAMRRQLARKP